MNETSNASADRLDLHDAELCLVTMDRELKTLALEFKTIDGTIRRVEFSNVFAQKIDNIQQQNVVSRVLRSDHPPGFGPDFNDILRWCCSGSSHSLLFSEERIDLISTEIREGALHLFYFDPTWGAEIGVIGQSMTVSKA